MSSAWPKEVKTVYSGSSCNYEYIITLNPGWSFSAKTHVSPKQFKTIHIAHNAATNKVFPCNCAQCKQVEATLPIAAKSSGILYSLGCSPDYGPLSKADIKVFRIIREGMKCRPCDIGKFAAGITVDMEYVLVPGGSISLNGLPRKYVHTCIMLFNTIDQAASAVEISWGEYGAGLPRDIVQVFNDAPVGVIFKLETFEENFLLRPVRLLSEQSSVSVGGEERRPSSPSGIEYGDDSKYTPSSDL